MTPGPPSPSRLVERATQYVAPEARQEYEEAVCGLKRRRSFCGGVQGACVGTFAAVAVMLSVAFIVVIGLQTMESIRTVNRLLEDIFNETSHGTPTPSAESTRPPGTADSQLVHRDPYSRESKSRMSGAPRKRA
ncbi:uncharacterized protein LOC144119398 [Amblyomma americanum]